MFGIPCNDRASCGQRCRDERGIVRIGQRHRGERLRIEKQGYAVHILDQVVDMSFRKAKFWTIQYFGVLRKDAAANNRNQCMGADGFDKLSRHSAGRKQG